MSSTLLEITLLDLNQQHTNGLWQHWWERWLHQKTCIKEWCQAAEDGDLPEHEICCVDTIGCWTEFAWGRGHVVQLFDAPYDEDPLEPGRIHGLVRCTDDFRLVCHLRDHYTIGPIDLLTGDPKHAPAVCVVLSVTSLSRPFLLSWRLGRHHEHLIQHSRTLRHHGGAGCCKSPITVYDRWVWQAWWVVRLRIFTVAEFWD